MFKFIILFFWGWCCFLPEQVEAKINPFLTQEEEKIMVEMGDVILLEYLQVSAIFYSPFESQSRAIINGKLLVLGGSIDNKEIIKINPEDVVLEDSQGQYLAKMVKLLPHTAIVE